MSRKVPKDAVTVLAAMHPEDGATPAHETAWVSARDFDQYVGIVLAGALGTSGTLTAQIEEANDDQGDGATPVENKVAAALTDASSDDDKQVVIHVRADELSADATHIRLRVLIGTAASLVGGVLLGLSPRYTPTTEATTVHEVVS